jgi:GTP-binding protein
MALFQSAQFLTTAVRKEQFPETDLPELVLAGRSNVGKSSLINSLTYQKALAYVGKRPGKTRYINFYEVPHQVMFVDVPGYGYAQRSASELIAYGKLMEDYFSDREQIAAVIQVIDVRHPLSEDDEDMLTFVEEEGYPVLIVATKSDKLTFSQKLKAKKELNEKYGHPVVLFSSLEKSGIEEVESWIKKFIKTQAMT